MTAQSEALLQHLQLLTQQGLSVDSGVLDAAPEARRSDGPDTLPWGGPLDFDIITEAYETDVESRRPFDPPGLAPDYGRFSVRSTPWTPQQTSTTGDSVSSLTITWGFAEDGTFINGFNGETSSDSNLIIWLDTLFYGSSQTGTDYQNREWFYLFQTAFARWEELSGLDFQYAGYDDSADLAYFNGVEGVRADYRIGGHRIDGNSGVLAYNFYPATSDMVIDTGDNFFGTTDNPYEFRILQVLMHEIGHGIGIEHVTGSSSYEFLMEPYINLNFTGPQIDEVLAVQRLYGDAYEKQSEPIWLTWNSSGQASVGSDGANIGITSADPVEMSVDYVNNTYQGGMTDFASIHNINDIDIFQFSLDATYLLDLNLNLVGPTYTGSPAQNDLELELYNQNNSLLWSANTGGVGFSESISLELGAGTYYVYVSGLVDTIQLYELTASINPTGTGGGSGGGGGDPSEPTIGEATGSQNVIVSGDLGSPLVETYTLSTTGRGKKTVTSYTFTTINISQVSPLDALVVNGGDSSDIISGQGFADDPNTGVNEFRSAFSGVLVLDGKGGADQLTGGTSAGTAGTNYLIGGGTSADTVDTLTGIALVRDVFDLRMHGGTNDWMDAYSGDGSAVVNDYSLSEDYIVLSGASSAYSIEAITTIVERTNRNGKVIGTTTTTYFEIKTTDDNNLIAQIHGSNFTEVSVLNIIYDQSTQSPFEVQLNGSTII